jgi:hypothetical protein
VDKKAWPEFLYFQSATLTANSFWAPNSAVGSATSKWSTPKDFREQLFFYFCKGIQFQLLERPETSPKFLWATAGSLFLHLLLKTGEVNRKLGTNTILS